MTETLTIERLRTLIDYNPETGVFKRKVKLSSRANLEKEIGVIAQNGRKYISVDGKPYLAHRLAWLYVTGSWPTQNIAFLDRDYLNLRFANLKEETFAETASKGCCRSGNSSGIKNVSWDKYKKKWVATKTQDYKRILLGYFDNKEDAAKAVSEVQNIQVDPEERKKNAEKVKIKARQRHLWTKMLRKFDGKTDWPSFEAFCKTVGDCSPISHEIIAVDETKPVGPDNFAWASLSEKRFSFRTKEGRSEYLRHNRQNRKTYYKHKDLIKSFGIGLPEYEKMFEEQNGVCEICKQPETATRLGKPLALSVDHNHSTGEIRGLLCTNCNKAIGLLKDDKSLLSSAIVYLTKHRKVTNGENP